MLSHHMCDITVSDAIVRLYGGREICSEVLDAASPYLSAKVASSNGKEPWVVQVRISELPSAAGKPGVSDDLGSLIVVHPQKKLIVVTGTSVSACAQSALRQVRMLLRFSLYSGSMVFLHGALVGYKTTGILIVGRKNSGKTSTVLSLAHRAGSIFVANDDASLLATDKEWIGFGWPRSVRVRADTLAYVFSAERDSRASVRLRHPYNAGMLFPSHNGPYHDGIINLMPHEISKLTGCSIQPRANVSLVVFTAIDPTARKKACLSEISRESGEKELLSHSAPWIPLPGMQFSHHLEPFFLKPPMAQVAEQIKRGSRSARFFVLSQCYETFEDGARQLAELASEH
jgi:hypothetical protein